MSNLDLDLRAVADGMAARVRELEYDARENAAMLARQCDLAREAETERDALAAKVRELELLQREWPGKWDALNEQAGKLQAERDALAAQLARTQGRLEDSERQVIALKAGQPQTVDGQEELDRYREALEEIRDYGQLWGVAREIQCIARAALKG